MEDRLTDQGDQILSFNLELEESAKTQFLYYTKAEDTTSETTWVSVNLRRDGETFDSMLYNDAQDLTLLNLW